MTSQINVAIIGAGTMAREHARAFLAHPGVRVVGVCGRDPQRAGALAAEFGTRTFDDPAQMFDATNADIVVVAVSEISTRDICARVFRRPWLCLIEKPAGLDLPEAEAIAADARLAGIRAYVAFNRRCYSSTLQASQLLVPDAGPRLVSVLDQQDQASVRLRRPDRVADNWMFVNSIHLVDYFSTFARGKATHVRHLSRWDPASPGHVVATVAFDSGDLGVYQAVWRGPGPWAVTITDHQQRLELRPLEELSVQKLGERRPTAVASDPVDVEFKPGLYRQAGEVLRALKGETPRLADLDEGLRSMSLCARLYEATQSP